MRMPMSVVLEETLLWLCSIASPTGEERALCDAVQERLTRLPLAARIRRYGNSIVVPLVRKYGPRRPHVALVGHLDTVQTENGPCRVEDGRCYGAGSADMKSGLSVMIVLAETATQFVGCNLTLVFYAREEGPFADNELGLVIERDPDLRNVDLAVCLEPSDNKVHVGCCGSIHATVRFLGKTGHSARPWEGDNAITKAAGLLAKLGELRPIEHRVEGHIYRTITTVTLASGGRGRNIVPDAFSLNINHRFAPDTSTEQAQKDVLALVGTAGGATRVEFTDVSPGARPADNHPLVQRLTLAGARSVEPKQAWTDVARFAALGIPAINFGPGENAQAHQTNESTDLGLVFESYRILHTWLSRSDLTNTMPSKP